MANSKVRGITIEFGADASGLKAALNDVNSQVRKTSQQLRDVNRAMKLDSTSPQLAAQKYTLLQESITKTKNKIDTLKKAQEELKSQMVNGGTDAQKQQFAALEREIITCEAQVKRFQNTWGSGSAALLNFGNKLTALGGKFSSIASNLKGATVAVTAFGAASVKAFLDVDKGSKEVVYATGAVGSSADSIRQSYQNVAKSVAGTFEEIGSTVGEVSTRFGLTGTELEQLSVKFQQFATITGQSGKSAVQGVDLALKTFNMSGSEAANVMGLLAKTAQNTGMSVETLEGLLQQSGAVLKEMGLGLAESVNLMATFEKAGIDSSTMLTSMKKAATYFSDSGQDMNTGLKDLCARLQDSATAAQATSEAYDIFGKRAGLAFVTAAKEGKINLSGLSNDLSQYANVVEETYNETRTGADKIAGAWKKVKLALEGLGEAIGNVVGPMLSNLAIGLGNVTKNFNNLDDGAKNAIVTFGLILVSVAPVLTILGKLTTGVGTLIKMLSSIRSLSIVASLGPVGIAITAMTAAIGGAIVITQNFVNSYSKVSDTMKKVQDKIKAEKEQWESLIQTRDAAINTASSQAAANNVLLQSLLSMVDATGRVHDSEQNRAQNIINQLNQALGTQMELQNGVMMLNGQEISSNDLLSKSIQDIINRRQAESALEANQSAYNEAIKNKTEYTKQYAMQVEEVKKAQEDVNRLNEVAARGGWNESMNQQYAAAAENLKKQSSELDNIKWSLNEANKAIQLQKDLTAGLNGDSQLLYATIEKINSTITSFDGSNFDSVAKSTRETVEGINAVTKAFLEGDERISKESVSSLANTLALQLAELEKAGGNVSEFVGQLSQESKTALEQADMAGTLTGEAKAGFEAYKAVADQETRDTAQIVGENLDFAAQTAGDSGANVSGSYAAGIGSNAGAAYEAAGSAADSAGQGVQRDNGSTFNWGADFMQGFMNGLKSIPVVNAALRIADQIREVLHFSRPDKGPLRDYETWMPHMMQGLARTMQNSKSVLLKQVNSIAQTINDTMNIQGTYSPVLKPVLDTSGMKQMAVGVGVKQSNTITSNPLSLKSVIKDALKDTDVLRPINAPTYNGVSVNDQKMVQSLIDIDTRLKKQKAGM